MCKITVFVLFIAFLHCFHSAEYHHRENTTDTREIIKYCITKQHIPLFEIHMLNASDQNKIVDGLLRRSREMFEDYLCLFFCITLPDFARIPNCFRRLNKLRSVEVFVEFCPDFVNVDSRLSGQCVEQFIESISYLDNVHRFCLTKMGLDTCPAAISKLKSLKFLSIGDKHLNPRSLDEINLPNLEELYICKVIQLEEIPKSVLDCSKLKWLRIEYCSLKHIPPTIRKLLCLEELSITKSQIKTMSKEIHSLRNLRILNIDCDQMLESVEIDLVLNPCLKIIYLEACNSLSKVVLNIPEKGSEIDDLLIRDSPVNELLVSPNLAFSKIGYFKYGLPQSLPPSCGDQLGWPEVVELCESRHSAIEYEIDGNIHVLDRLGLSNFNRFYWKLDVLNHCLFDLEKKNLDKDDFMFLWKMVVNRAGIDILGCEKSDYERSLLYLRNLYGESVEDLEGSIKFTYVQYKPTMIILLSELFKAINDSSLDHSILKEYVKSIFRMFHRPQGVQLVYFYHLFKIHSKEEVQLEEFIKNSIAILKDYIFTMTVNLKGYDQELLDEYKTRAKNIGLIPDNEVVINFANDGKYYEKEVLPLFNYKFSPDWFCKIVAGAINLNEEFKRHALVYISMTAGDSAEYFEYECVEGSNFALDINAKGISVFLIKAGLIGLNQAENNPQ